MWLDGHGELGPHVGDAAGARWTASSAPRRGTRSGMCSMGHGDRLPRRKQRDVARRASSAPRGRLDVARAHVDSAPTWEAQRDVARAHVDSAPHVGGATGCGSRSCRLGPPRGRRSWMWLALTSTRLPPGTRSRTGRLDLARPTRGRRSGMWLDGHGELGPTWEMQRALDGRRARLPTWKAQRDVLDGDTAIGSHVGSNGMWLDGTASSAPRERRNGMWLDGHGELAPTASSAPTWEAQRDVARRVRRARAPHVGRAAGRVDLARPHVGGAAGCGSRSRRLGPPRGGAAGCGSRSRRLGPSRRRRSGM
jgi:hypothetical protein